MRLTPTDRYYRRWIRNISKRVTPGEIEKHIIYHAHDLQDTTRNLPHSWLASMINLLNVYQEVHRFRSTTPEQLYKIGNKYFKYKGWTPPPGGKIPKNVRLTQIQLGKKKRAGEKPVTSAELRGIGRGVQPRWSRQDAINKLKSTKQTERIFRHSRPKQ